MDTREVLAASRKRGSGLKSERELPRAGPGSVDGSPSAFAAVLVLAPREDATEASARSGGAGAAEGRALEVVEKVLTHRARAACPVPGDALHRCLG